MLFFSSQQTHSPEAVVKLSSPDGPLGNQSSIPPPLNIPPSRARRQLAARLAQRKREAEAVDLDPDAADAVALETASQLPEEPRAIDLGPATDRAMSEATGLQITGLRPVGGLQSGSASRFSGLFGSDDSSSSGEEEEEEEEDDDDDDEEEESAHEGGAAGPKGSEHAAQGEFLAPVGGVGRRRSQRAAGKDRRPSTTEAKERTLLDDDEDDEDLSAADLGEVMDRSLHFGNDGEGPFADPVEMDEEEDSSEDELVEIKPRKTS